MQTIKEYLINNHVSNAWVETIDGVDCFMIDEMPGAYIYLTLPSVVDHGAFETDKTSKKKPLIMSFENMVYFLDPPKRPEDEYRPFWQLNSVYENRSKLNKAFKAGKLDIFKNWFKKITGETNIIIGMCKGPGDFYYVDLSEDTLNMKTAKADDKGYCCLMYDYFKPPTK